MVRAIIDKEIHKETLEEHEKVKCKCGHSHIAIVGDFGENKDRMGWSRILPCTMCDCEHFKRGK